MLDDELFILDDEDELLEELEWPEDDELLAGSQPTRSSRGEPTMAYV